jgi:hypothetical protein
MTTFLNQIFYKCNKFDTIDSIENLTPFMLTNENHKKLLDSIQENTMFVSVTPNIRCVPIESTPVREQPKSSVFFPQRENSLFWCMFIAQHGYAEYEYIGKKYANRELQEKQLIADTMKKTPAVMKNTNHKITNIMCQEIISELIIVKPSSLLTLFAFIAYYKKYVIIVNGNTHMFFSFTKSNELNDMMISNEQYENIIILEYKDSDFGIELEVTKEKIETIMQNTFRLESIEKPLKSISSYKVTELENIARLLQIKLETSVKKTELYEIIYNKAKWECQQNR